MKTLDKKVVKNGYVTMELTFEEIRSIIENLKYVQRYQRCPFMKNDIDYKLYEYFLGLVEPEDETIL